MSSFSRLLCDRSRTPSTRVPAPPGVHGFAIVAILAALASVIGYIGRVQQAGLVPGNGIERSEQRTVAPFSQVTISGGFALDISVGSPASLGITADENVLPLIQTTVENGALTIRPLHPFADGDVAPRVALTTPVLEALRTDGSTQTVIHGLRGGGFRLATSGSAQVVADGRVDSLSVNSAGSSDLELQALVASSATVVASGSASIAVDAADSIGGTVSGSVVLRYSGSPVVSVEPSGNAIVIRT